MNIKNLIEDSSKGSYLNEYDNHYYCRIVVNMLERTQNRKKILL